jgi:O-antigen/teichoic acid export membrane protein
VDSAVEERGDLGRLGRNTSLKIAGAACNALLMFALMVIVTRSWGQEDAGLFFTTAALLLLVGQVAQIGADEAVLRYVPAYRATGRGGEVRHLLRRAFRSVMVASAVGALAVGALAPALAGVVTDGRAAHDLAMLLRAAAPFVPLVALTEIAVAATRGYQTMRPTVMISDLLLPGSQVVLAGVAASRSDGVLPLLLAYAVPYAMAALLACCALRRLVAGEEAVPCAPRETGYWRFALPRVAARISQHVFRRVDVLLVAALAGPVDAALYAAVARFVSVGTVGVHAAQVAAQPTLSELIETRQRRRALEVFQATSTWLMAASWPVFVLLAVFAPAVLEAFGPGYRDGATALAVLCGAYVVGVGTGPVDIVLVVSGRSLLSMANQLLALAVQVGGCVLLVPAHGVTGAALATGAGVVVSNVLAAVQVRMGTALHVFSAGALVVGAATALFAAVSLLARAVVGPGVGGLAVAGSVSGVIGLVTAMRFRALLRLDALVQVAARDGD